ncbi:hypothetical protein HHK36_023519 [Tetracentron sinense]|uniref:DOG1 domain-containing protein n=1 Tax=Tetracentron sinense TaxID=13715 RepID=A0A835D7Z6_TETSI|nr:hypothetical protein HHK36_023519 [Tetracentron sinense]
MQNPNSPPSHASPTLNPYKTLPFQPHFKPQKLQHMRNQVENNFSEFFEKWILQHEANLQQLLSVSKNPSNEQEQRVLISKVTTHYKEYYSAKWAAAKEDVLGFFSPPWLTPLENAYLWMTGWKPSLAFRLLDSVRYTGVPGSSLADMSGEQLKKIEDLRVKIKVEEEKVEREMERQQVAMADRRMVELAQLTSRVRDGVGEIDGLVEVALKGLLVGLERVMKMGDCVRLKTLKWVFEVLTPLQCVDFMAAASMLQIQLRKWGKNRDSQQGS